MALMVSLSTRRCSGLFFSQTSFQGKFAGASRATPHSVAYFYASQTGPPKKTTHSWIVAKKKLMTFGEDPRVSSKFSPKKVNPIRAYEDAGKWWQRCACSPPNLASLCSCWICIQVNLVQKLSTPQIPKYDQIWMFIANFPIEIAILGRKKTRFWHTYLYDSICLHVAGDMSSIIGLGEGNGCFNIRLRLPCANGDHLRCFFWWMSSPLMFESYPLVNIQKTMENHHAINGTTHYFYGHFQ